MPVLPSYKKANQLTGVYMKATLAFNGLIEVILKWDRRLIVVRWPYLKMLRTSSLGCTSSWNKSSVVIFKKYYQTSWYYLVIRSTYTAWKVSVFGVFLVRFFPHSDWIRTGKILNTDTFHEVLLPGLLWLHVILMEFFNASQASIFLWSFSIFSGYRKKTSALCNYMLADNPQLKD